MTRKGPLLLLLALGVGASAHAEPRSEVLHEPIAPNPREDVSFGLALDGELPSAVQTSQGLVAAPDPRRAIGHDEHAYRVDGPTEVTGESFRPDRDTRRPDTLPYDDPFIPSTAPFKRLAAFDAVDASYTLKVRSKQREAIVISAATPSGSDRATFYADMVVDLAGAEPVRIPSVGPGARVHRARAGVGGEDVPIAISRDSADNWFVTAKVSRRVRLVMEVSVPRSAFGGDYGNPAWSDLPRVSPLPTRVARAGQRVAEAIGVKGRGSPREKVAKLVAYFRSFEDSDDPPPPSFDIYLDLALSKKGVCRHRAFAFLVTALAVGIPTRMVVNEAHAWVEVHDGRAFRRIDLGGAGRALERSRPSTERFEPPPDAFAWPSKAARGDALSRTGPTTQASPGAPSTPAGSREPTRGVEDRTAGTPAPRGPSSPSSTSRHASGEATRRPPPDARPTSLMALEVGARDALRGGTVHVTGKVSAASEPCAQVPVQLFLRRRDGVEVVLGELPTDAHGILDTVVLLPAGIQLGDYELHARTSGGFRCGSGSTL